MATARLLVDVLKRELKARRMTYADVARGLRISEASVKRTFASRRMSLERLDAVCALLGVEVSDLLRQHDAEHHRVSELTEAQEAALVANPRRLLVALCVKNRWTFEELTRELPLSAAECVRHLAHLDRLRLIELLPGNRYRLLFSDDFRWRARGPIETFFARVLVGEFLGGEFHHAGARRLFLNGWLTANSREYLLRRLDQLADEFNDHLRWDATYPVPERRHVGLMLAFRPFVFDLLALESTPARTPSAPR